MKPFTRHLGWAFVALIFVITLLGIQFDLAVGQLLLAWSAFLAGGALVVGTINLFLTHLRRTGSGNLNSTILVLSMVLVWLAPILNTVLEEDWEAIVFEWIQVPIEAAFGSLILFFLLFAAMRLFQRREGRSWTLFFAAGTGIVLLASVTLPSPFHEFMQSLRQVFEDTVVTAGVKGILLGIALGTITMSMRILGGTQRPYSK